jgi:hypothetical protein
MEAKMSGKIVWAVGDKVQVTGEEGHGVVTEVIPQIWGFNMYNVEINGRVVRMVADKPALPSERTPTGELKLTDPPKPKFAINDRVVVKSLKGTSTNEATIVLVGAAVLDKDDNWFIEYLVDLAHNGEQVQIKESDLAEIIQKIV